MRIYGAAIYVLVRLNSFIPIYSWIKINGTYCWVGNYQSESLYVYFIIFVGCGKLVSNACWAYSGKQSWFWKEEKEQLLQTYTSYGRRYRMS